MKKIELLAERAKTVSMLEKSEYYTLKLTAFTGECVQKPNVTETQLKERYENDEKLLKKLDAINNTLFESDAKEYVEVMGNRLSVATARKYLEEFDLDVLLDKRQDTFDIICEHEEVSPGCNLRGMMYSNCVVFEYESVDKDPLYLKNRVNEFKEKQLDWYYGLKTAVMIADVTTEVNFPY